MRRFTDAPRTTEEHVQSITHRVENLERRNPPAITVVYVQPDEPGTLDSLPVGTLWFDTDEPVV